MFKFPVFPGWISLSACVFKNNSVNEFYAGDGAVLFSIEAETGKAGPVSEERLKKSWKSKPGQQECPVF